jgi:Ca-activated chloride channel family protein
MMQFVWPWAFWLLPLPFLVYKGLPKARKYDAALYVPFYHDVVGFEAKQYSSARTGFIKVLLLMLMWCLLVLAISRPQWIGEPIALPSSGRDLMLAVDISGSMKIDDMIMDGKQVERITLVKKVVNEFVERRTGDRVGLLLFGTEAYLQVPLTFDRKTVKTLFNEAQLGFAGEKTSIGDAIGLAVKRLKERPDDSRVLILLTDGMNTAGKVEPVQAAQLAAQTNVKIYTIGVGADEMIVRDFFGSRRINPSAELDEETLQEIADLTGGKYFRARDPEELEKIYQLIDKLEPVKQEDETFRPVKALFYLPLAGALILSFLAACRHIPFFSRRKRTVKA